MRRRASSIGWLAAAVAVAISAIASGGAAAAMPAHGRAWELVTGGANGAPLIQSRAWSPDGDRVLVPSIGPLSGAPTGELFSNSLAVRGPGGWTVRGIGEPFSAGAVDVLGSGPVAIDTGLSAWIWSSVFPLLPGAPGKPLMALYRRAPGSGLTLLGDVGEWQPGFTVHGTSVDLSHVGFETQQSLLPEDDHVAGRAAYELVDDELRLVGVDDGGVPLTNCGSVLGNGSYDISNGSFDPAMSPNSISDDGSRVFFTSPDPNAGICGSQRRVYLRVGGADTTDISVSQCTRPDCNGPDEVRFQGATSDGSSALLASAQQLTDDDVDDGVDLYRYDVASGDLTRLSTGPPGVVADADFFIARASDDGDRIYFVAGGELTAAGEGATGARNLYVRDHGETRYVGEVDPGGAGGIRFASATPDGNVLLFATHAQLLPSDTDTAADVYRYEADDDALTLISAAEPGLGNATLDAALPTASIDLMPGQTLRSLSADGERAFFLTPEALVPDDANDDVDVYEWVDGDVGLISSGAGDDRLLYSGASADGRSVFFMTDEALLPGDRDGGDRDLYVARLGGGFATPGPPAACDGDACQGPPRARGDRRAPATSTLASPRAGFAIRAITPAARRRLARTGQAALIAVVPAGGPVTLVARARIGGRTRVVARDRAVAAGPARVELRLRLSGTARQALRRAGLLRLRIAVRHRGAPPRRTVVLLRSVR
jgi:Tol biopolymer transport system component